MRTIQSITQTHYFHEKISDHVPSNVMEFLSDGNRIW